MFNALVYKQKLNKNIRCVGLTYQLPSMHFFTNCIIVLGIEWYQKTRTHLFIQRANSKCD